MKRFLAFVLLVILAVYGLFLWNRQRPVPYTYTPAPAPKLDLKDVEILAAMDQAYTTLVESVTPSVVSLTTSRTVRTQPHPLDFFFGPQRGRTAPRFYTQNSLGSGVIVSQEGHIVTNNHVVANFDEIKVHLRDGRDFPARIIGSDEANDIAVLKIDASGLAPLPLGDSDQVRVGSLVLAIGNPFGLQETVTRGIISATGRQLSDDSGTEFFQTDTAINPGNSGGPLVNLRGEIIAINTAIGNYSGSGTWQGVGFAIPANTVRRSLDAIINAGRVVRGYLGVAILPQRQQTADTGALIAAITPDSPAEKAGLQPDDLVISYDGREIRTGRDLIRRVAASKVGETVKLKIIRDGKEMELSAVIEERPANYLSGRQQLPAPGPQQPQPQQPGPQSQTPPGTVPQTLTPDHPLYGIRTEAIPEKLRKRLPENVHGVMITSIANDAGVSEILRPGDIIEEVGGQPVETPEEFEAFARNFQPGQRAILLITRGKYRSYVVIGP